MNTVVVLRQVPDLIEPLEIAASGAAFDLGCASFILNETDDHALEQALLLKQAGGGTVTIVAADYGDVDNALYAAAAKGADRVLKVALAEGGPPPPRSAARAYAEVVRPLQADLVLLGVQAHDEWDGGLAPFLASALELPYLGVVRGVKAGSEPGDVIACKEFPGAVMARMRVRLPAVLGILAADQAPRYVPVSRIRAAMKSTQFEEHEGHTHDPEALATVAHLYPPESGTHAEMLSGSLDELTTRIMEILAGKGLVK